MDMCDPPTFAERRLRELEESDWRSSSEPPHDMRPNVRFDTRLDPVVAALRPRRKEFIGGLTARSVADTADREERPVAETAVAACDVNFSRIFLLREWNANPYFKFRRRPRDVP